jgi:hypothetical protein
MVDKSEVTKIDLHVAQGLPEWRENSTNDKKYQIGFMETSKTMLANLTEAQSKEINKTLLDDIYKVAGDLESEELYVTLSLLDPNKDKIVRNLIVYGFERTDAKKFVTNPEVIMLRMDVNQEYDFVDLQ